MTIPPSTLRADLERLAACHDAMRDAAPPGGHLDFHHRQEAELAREAIKAIPPTAPAPCAPFKDYTNLNDDSAGALEEVAKRIDCGDLRRTDADVLCVVAREIRHALATHSNVADCHAQNVAELHRADEEIGKLRADLATARAENDSLARCIAEQREHLVTLTNERDAARAGRAADVERLVRERDAARETGIVFLSERDAARAALDVANGHALELKAGIERLRGELDNAEQRVRVWREWGQHIVDAFVSPDSSLRAAIDQKLAAKSLPARESVEAAAHYVEELSRTMSSGLVTQHLRKWAATLPADSAPVVFTDDDVRHLRAVASREPGEWATYDIADRIAQLVPAAEAKGA